MSRLYQAWMLRPSFEWDAVSRWAALFLASLLALFSIYPFVKEEPRWALVLGVVAALITAFVGIVRQMWKGLDRKIDVYSHAKVFLAHSRADWSVGQSEVIDLGYESPVLELPRNFTGSNFDDRKEAYVETLQRLPQLAEANARELYDRWTQELCAPFHNEPNVIIDAPLESLSQSLKGHPLEFAAIRGLEKYLDWRPFGITGNVLPVTPDGRTVLLHNRGRRISTDAPDQFHIFGGAINPCLDSGSLARCASREFREEAGRSCNITNCPVLLQRESTYKKSMITFLGAPIQETNSYEMEEGEVFALDLLELDAVLNCFKNKHWVESGRQAFLVWLSLGCPVGGKRSVIPVEHSQELYKKLLGICREKGLLKGW